MARPRLAVTFAVLWSTTAIGSLAGADSELRFVGPARRTQPRPASAAKLTTPARSPRFDASRINSTISLEPVLRTAAKWRTKLLLAPPQEESDSAAADELPGPVDDTEVLVVPQSEPSDESTEAAADGQTPACFVAPPLASLSIDISLPAGKLPTDFAAQCAAETPRIIDPRMAWGWAMVQHEWSATCLHHRPLYFEEINAERYGYTNSYLLQPLISGVRFFATIPALPYLMAVDRPRDCVYTLGHYRPGSCVPWRSHHLPLRLTAGAVEVGFIAGLILLLP